MTEAATAGGDAAYAPIVKTVLVKASPEQAFHRFTAEIGTWWPLGSHSVGRDRSEGVDFDGRVGGQITERIRGGEPAIWGTVTAWDPPRRVAFTWRPGQPAEKYNDIEIVFEPAGDRTRVTLTHTGFERLGEMARRARMGYPIGWTFVLGRFARRRDPVMLMISGLNAAVMTLVRLRGRAAAKD
ncbi:MAG: SRPBCC domain-containing protein [Pseudomonadota bacterium]